MVLHHTGLWRSNDWGYELTMGRSEPDKSVLHLVGHNSAVGVTLQPLTHALVWQTPQVGSVTTLRVKAGGNANDTAAGTGAREITLVGLDATGAEITETLATAGASASAATTQSFLRLNKAYVSKSGSYPAAAVGSHAGTITIEDSGGTADWAVIDLGDIAEGLAEMGCYAVPLGYRATLSEFEISVESGKTATVYMMQRQNILEAAAPYTPAKVVYHATGLAGSLYSVANAPYGPFPELTDLMWLAKVPATAAAVVVDFEIVLEKM